MQDVPQEEVEEARRNSMDFYKAPPTEKLRGEFTWVGTRKYVDFQRHISGHPAVPGMDSPPMSQTPTR